MASDPQAAAIASLQALRERLDSGPPDASAVEECDHLIRAVEAFHMEGVRFRFYGLRRRLAAADPPAADDLPQLVKAAGEALRAAGFGTR